MIENKKKSQKTVMNHSKYLRSNIVNARNKKIQSKSCLR